MEIAIEQGRLADAEKLFNDATNDPRVETFVPPHAFLIAYCQQGRVAEAEHLVEADWDRLNRAGQGASERAIQLARLHVFLRLEPMPDDAIRGFVDHAAKLAPDDDRMWLSRANLEIGAGRFDVAEGLLEKCQGRRPEDPPVWRALMRLAIERKDVAAAQKAAAHVRFDTMRPGQADYVAAWIQGQRGDGQREREVLDRVVAAEPDNLTAIDRLAELAVQNHEPASAAKWKRQRVEIERAMARYKQLDQRNQPIRDAAELAHLAISLGQWFEARAFLTLAVEANPDRTDLRNELAGLLRDPRAAASRHLGSAIPSA